MSAVGVMIGAILALAGLVIGFVRLTAYRQALRKGSQPSLPKLGLPLLLLLSGVLAGGYLGSVSVVPVNHAAVIENSLNGSITVISAGTYAWPLEPRLVPFVTRVTTYSLRQNQIEIGGALKGARGERQVNNGVASTSNSPGQPTVFFYARGWAEPNPVKLEQLHRRYGSAYVDTWVEPVWVTTLKSVQGQRAFDYIQVNRARLENEVETTLQAQLLDEDGQPIVFVRQLAIVDFDYDDETNKRLQQISQREFDRQQAAAQVEINQQRQRAAVIEAETNYNNTKRAAEAEQARRIAEAEGQAQATRTQAQAEAFKIETEAKARAGAIRELNAAVSTAPGYLEYQRTERWNGQLPQYMLGSAPLPFIEVPTGSEAPTGATNRPR